MISFMHQFCFPCYSVHITLQNAKFHHGHLFISIYWFVFTVHWCGTWYRIHARILINNWGHFSFHVGPVWSSCMWSTFVRQFSFYPCKLTVNEFNILVCDFALMIWFDLQKLYMPTYAHTHTYTIHQLCRTWHYHAIRDCAVQIYVHFHERFAHETNNRFNNVINKILWIAWNLHIQNWMAELQKLKIIQTKQK